MIRRFAALVLAAHGVAHLVGFLAAFQLGDFAGRAVETKLLWGQIEVSLGTIQVMGVGWLLLAIGFLGVAVALWRSLRHAVAGVALVTAMSLGLTTLQSPMAVIGLVLNVVILLGVVIYAMLPRNLGTGRPAGFTGPTMPVH